MVMPSMKYCGTMMIRRRRMPNEGGTIGLNGREDDDKLPSFWRLVERYTGWKVDIVFAVLVKSLVPNHSI